MGKNGPFGGGFHRTGLTQWQTRCWFRCGFILLRDEALSSVFIAGDSSNYLFQRTMITNIHSCWAVPESTINNPTSEYLSCKTLIAKTHGA